MDSQQLKRELLEEGAAQVGFSYQEETPYPGLHYCITLVMRLSDPVVNQIDGAPTQSYFHHYRTMNAYIDQLMLRTILKLQKEGFQAAPVPASQSVGQRKKDYQAIFPHKTGAVAAGLGSIGKSALFISREYGVRVRLGTIFTDMPLPVGSPIDFQPCKACNRCVTACPAGAISGEEWRLGCVRETIFQPEKCSEHMKKAYQQIGRGAVCGICMRVCPHVK